MYSNNRKLTCYSVLKSPRYQETDLVCLRLINFMSIFIIRDLDENEGRASVREFFNEFGVYCNKLAKYLGMNPQNMCFICTMQ